VLPCEPHRSPIPLPALFQGLDGTEKGTEGGLVALGIRVGPLPFVRYADVLPSRLTGLGQGQFGPDVDFELVQGDVVSGLRGGHFSPIVNWVLTPAMTGQPGGL
jgi:hypothetical protein